MNKRLEALLNRLETTKIPRAVGTLRTVYGDGEVGMCPLGHLVDLYIEDTPGARWLDDAPDYFVDPYYENPKANLGFPTEEMLDMFDLTQSDAYEIYRQNDSFHRTPAQMAQFIRERKGLMETYRYFRWGIPTALYYRVSDYENPRGPRVEICGDDREWSDSAWSRQGRDYWDGEPSFEEHRHPLSLEEAMELGLNCVG